jgi:hypothetical protein
MQNYVLIVNWSRWKDTVECLESVLRLSGTDFQVVVCDNDSEDGSVERIREWANGTITAQCVNPALSSFISPPVSKPISYREVSRAEVEQGLAIGNEQLVQICMGANLMYAGGNNVGLQYALQDPEARYFWILNNDTIVDPNALTAMVDFMKKHPDAGMCGSLNLAYYKPSEVQAQGGRGYSRWTGRPLLQSIDVKELHARPEHMDYVVGASMLVSREFVEQVGFLNESYYIYFEEMDWAERARGKFKLGYAPESIIYHKEGAAIGTNADRSKRSLTSERYQSRNRVLFARRYCPWTLPTVLATVFATAVHRLCHGDPVRAGAILAWGCKGIFADWRGRRQRLVATA